MRFLLLLVCSALTVPLSSQAQQQPERPNIIVFLVDDLGWQDTSVPFYSSETPLNKRYHTPNMERMAQSGLKFTQAYATAVCSPSRVSYLTGMNAARHRVTNWTLHANEIKPMETNHKTLDIPFWNVNGVSVEGVPNSVKAEPLPKRLAEAGYTTIHCGKAHFGAIGTPGEDPLKLGFQVNIAGHAAGAPGSYLGEDNYGNGNPKRKVWAVPGLDAYHGTETNLTEALTLEAKKALEDALKKDRPFYLHMAHYGVHTPIMQDRRFYQKYLEKGLDTIEAKYASMVEAMDKSLGDLLDFLEEKQIVDNTLVLFMSDNGGLSAVARGGEKHTHNKPLASGKGSIYEGGIREPMLAYWPAVIKAGTVTDQPLIIEDFYPTLLEVAGVSIEATPQTLDGKSFTPLFRGQRMEYERPLYWHFPNKWGGTGPGIGAYSAIRKGDWKLIYFHEDQHLELFNLKDDIGETRNLTLEKPHKSLELAGQLTEYLKSVKAQMPVVKATGKPVPWPNAVL